MIKAYSRRQSQTSAPRVREIARLFRRCCSTVHYTLVSDVITPYFYNLIRKFPMVGQECSRSKESPQLFQSHDQIVFRNSDLRTSEVRISK
jgi:hypothetical protein